MNQPLNGKSLKESLQAPPLQKLQIAQLRELNSLPINSPEYNQLWNQVAARARTIKKAKAADDLLMNQALANIGVSLR